MKQPNVVGVTGNHGYLRDRYLREFIRYNERQGRLTERVDGKVPGALSASLGGGFMFTAKSQVVVANLQEADFALVLDHLASGDLTTIAILYYPGKPRGNTKFAKFLKGIPEHHSFEEPKRWDAPAAAEDFVLRETVVQGYEMDLLLAQALVAKVGPDLGMLSFEIFKAGILAGAEGTKKIEPTHVKRTLATFGEATFDALFQAVEFRNFKGVARALEQIRTKSKKDLTMGVCRSLGGVASKWLCAASFLAAGVPDALAAGEMGMNPWYYKNNIAPVARRWGEERLGHLVHALATSERAVLAGHLNPWAGLTCRLLRVCIAER